MDERTHAAERFRLKIGDTERSAEEVVADLKHYGEPVIEAVLETPGTGRTAAGASVILAVSAAGLDEPGLMRKLNEAGGCMYQIASVTKLA